MNRQRGIALDLIVYEVKKRGGPAARGRIDLDNHRATLERIETISYGLNDRGFALQG